MKKLSVAIGAYEMRGEGAFFIKRCIDSIISQEYENIEIVVSDHSLNDDVKNECEKYNNVVYIRNENNRGSSSANFNNAIKHCTGDYIKILCQDDCLYGSDSAKNIVDAFGDEKWLVSSYYHTHDFKTPTSLHHPGMNSFNPLVNVIGTHSCLTICKDVDVYFDELLIWFMDCEYYARLYEKYSYPKYLFTPTMVQSVWEGQVSRTMITSELVDRETEHILSKDAYK